MKPNTPDWYRRYCGTKYIDRGRSLETGLDCWGVVFVVEPHDFNLTVDDHGEVYPPNVKPGTPQGVALARARIETEMPGWQAVPWEEGAVALFKVRAQPVHVGVCTGTRGVVLHSHGSTGVDLLDLRTNLKWKDRFMACYLPIRLASRATAA